MTAPWFKADTQDWAGARSELIASGMEWPLGLIRLDLRWWEDQERMGRASRPSSRELARQWGTTHWKARQALKSGWELDAPHSSRTPSTQQPHTARTPGTGGHGALNDSPHSSHTDAAQAPHQNRPTRVPTEHRTQSTEEEQGATPLASPAEPVPPAAPEPPEQTTLVAPAADPLPLWEQRGLPKLGKGCPAKLLTSDVLDVWEYWQKVHVEAGRGKARTIGKDAVKAIHEALQWEPSSADECPDGWTVKRLLCTVLAYAYRAPDGSPGVDWWRSPSRRGSDLNPETLLRLGRDAKLPRNARWAVAWSLAQRSPSLQVLDGGKGEQQKATAHPMPLLAELWAKWSNPLTRRSDFEQLGIRPEDWRSFIQAAVVAGQAREISAMHPIDRKASEARFTESVRAWLNEPGREVACG